MQAFALPLQPWMASMTAWQSVFLPHAAAGFAHVLSMHLPQSLSPSAAAGGGAAGALADEAAGAALDVSLAAAEPADAGRSVLDEESAVDGVEAPESSPEELSSAGVSGGLPAQASQVS